VFVSEDAGIEMSQHFYFNKIGVYSMINSIPITTAIYDILNDSKIKIEYIIGTGNIVIDWFVFSSKIYLVDFLKVINNASHCLEKNVIVNESGYSLDVYNNSTDFVFSIINHNREVMGIYTCPIAFFNRYFNIPIYDEKTNCDEIINTVGNEQCLLLFSDESKIELIFKKLNGKKLFSNYYFDQFIYYEDLNSVLDHQESMFTIDNDKLEYSESVHIYNQKEYIMFEFLSRRFLNNIFLVNKRLFKQLKIKTKLIKIYT